MKLNAQRLLPFAPVLLAPFILFADILFTGRSLYWGLPILQFIPWRAYAVDSMAQGVLPLWNPLNGMGAPLLANYQLAFFYPPSWLLLAAQVFGGSPAQAWASTFLLALHMSWAGLGMVRLLKTLSVDTLGQAVGSLAFSLCGYFAARSSVFPIVWAGAWLPWVIFFVARGEIPGRRDAPAAPLFDIGLSLSLLMLLLAGHAQVSWYIIVLAAVWALVGGWSRQGACGALRAAARLMLAGLAAVVLAAVQLIPTAEYLLQSQRASAVDFELGMTYSFWPWRLLSFLAPDLFGNPGSGTYWGYAAYWEDAVYIGLLPLLLALSSLPVVLRPRSAARRDPCIGLFRFLWAVVLVALLLALGKNTPLFPFLYRFIPTFSLFQAPTRWMLLGLFALCLLAGIQAGRWRRSVGRSGRWLRRGIAAAGAVTLGAGAAWFVLRDVEITFVSATASAGLLAFVAGLLALKAPLPEEQPAMPRWSWLVVLFVLLDLTLAGWSLKPGASPALFRRGSAPAQAVLSAVGQGRLFLDPSEEYLIKYMRFLRFTDFRPLEDPANIRAALLPNINLLDGIASANNFDPFVPARYSIWMDHLAGLSPPDREPYLRLMGVSLVESMDLTTPVGVLFDRLEGSRRWYWTGCAVQPAPGQDTWAALKTALATLPLGQSPDWVLLEDRPSPSAPCETSLTGASLTLLSERPDRLEFALTAPSAGWLVLADTWYPGWQAFVDGRPVELLRANDLFRAASVPPGQHTVVFSYQPLSFKIGLGFCGLGWLVLVAGFWLKKRQKTGM